MSVKQNNNTSADNSTAETGDQYAANNPINEPDAKETDRGDEMDLLIEKQQTMIQELQEELARVKDTQLRKAAEMENMKKRLQREREQIFQIARESAVADFFSVSDDLQRTLDAVKNDDSGAPYLDGIKLIAQKFDDLLEKQGVVRIDETGVPFDVELHDALLSQKPEDKSVESGTVLQIVENGYRMGDKTLRHAKVIVSQ